MDYQTERLQVQNLSLSDSAFIFELVNTSGWIKFIGDRNITNTEDANTYIAKILANDQINYWVVKLKSGDASIGIITLIKRNYLDHHDIGFAFLPAYSKMGFAFEAAKCVLDQLKLNETHKTLLATTIKDNVNSIRLLEKLGFSFQKSITADGEDLLVYESKMNEKPRYFGD